MNRWRPIVLTALASLPWMAAPGRAQRAIGIDVSDYQGTINWPTVAKPVALGGGGIQFSFIRASRGGTSGIYNENTQVGTLSHRYDDLTFATNIANAKANGVIAGPYHFARIDRINATDPSDPTYAGNTGLDEANHFLQVAGNYMRPGYLRPVCDVEAGDVQTTPAQLTNWVLQFSDRILAVTGVRPIVYINSNYANNEVDARINIHDLWLARYVDPSVVNVQTSDPPPANSTSLANVYGVWNPSYPTIPAVKPWDFWQYTSTGHVAGIGNGTTTNVDRDVANGDLEFVKDFMVPALWTADADGAWTTPGNWNSATYLPAAKDRVVVNRPAGSYVVMLASGTHTIRSLQMNEMFAMTGGSLAVEQYANLAGDTSVEGTATLTAGSIVNSGGYAQGGGAVTAGAVSGGGSIELTGGTLRASTVKHNQVSISGGTLRLQGGGTSVIKLLTLSGGRLELAEAKLIVDYASASPINAIRTALRNGYNGGDWLGAGLALPADSSPTLAIAYLESRDLFTDFTTATFGGERVDASALLIARALRGDTNLSGAVDFDDLLALAQHYGGSGRWHDGDVNYDALVDFDDLLAVSQNYGSALLRDGTFAPGDASGFAADWALAQALVPEPAIACWLVPLLMRRRRRGSRCDAVRLNSRR